MKEVLEGQPDNERLWGAEEVDSVFVHLAEILTERGIKGIELAGYRRTHADRGMYIAIHAEKGSEGQVLMNRISKMPEMKALESATYRDESEPEFKDIGDSEITLDEFKVEHLQYRLIALYYDNKLNDWLELNKHELKDDPLGDAAMGASEYSEYKRQYLRWSENPELISGEEIRELIEIIVDSQGIPRKEKSVVKEFEIIHLPKTTLRAHEIADLDPYGVRPVPSMTAANELLEEIKERGWIEENFSEYNPESSQLMVAEELKSRGYKGIEIRDLEDGSKQIAFKETPGLRIFKDLLKHPDLKLLDLITSANIDRESYDFSQVTFSKFKIQRMQHRLMALKYDIQIKDFERHCIQVGSPLNSASNVNFIFRLEEKKRAALDNNLRSPFTVPDKNEVRSWVRKIITTYLRSK